MKLPLNCEAEYIANLLPKNEADMLFSELCELVHNTPYRPTTINETAVEVDFKKILFLDQQLIDEERFPENIWGPTHLYTSRLEKLKESVQHFTQHEFRVCVLIYYPDGHSGVSYHSDLTAFGDTSVIPSISLGEERIFLFRDKESSEEYSLILEHGSSIVMGMHCQNRYEHSLPVNPKYKKPRINLTFRKYGF